MSGLFKSMLGISSRGSSSSAGGRKGSSASSAWEPLSLGEGDAGFGMSLVVERPKPDPNRITLKVKYAPSNMYASLIEKGLRKGAEGGEQEPWLLYVGVNGTVVAFHFASGTWHKVKFSVAGQRYIRKAWAGGGARILIELVEPRDTSNVNIMAKLWNPVTGSLCTLPRFQAIRHPLAFGLTNDTIIAAGTDEAKVYTWVEVFTAGSWRALGSVPRPYAVRLEPIVECAGSFYALLMFPDHHMLEIRPQGPNYLNVCAIPNVWRATLVDCQGSLYCVGTGPDDDGVRIWKLCEGAGEQSCWKDVARPVSPCANVERNLISIISVGSSLVFCYRNHHMVSFDLAKSAWGSLPLCPEPSSVPLKWHPAPNDNTF